MLLPIKWLKEYVEIEENSKILADNLTLSGSHVESIISLDRGIENVVIGKVLELSKHENADKLFITNIDIGGEIIQIVTGADNVRVGDYLPVALIGAKLPNGLTIEETDFRGVISYGMLCSLKELGFSDNVIPREQRDGIFILKEEYPLGTDINEVLGLCDDIIEFEITPNRPDCLSIIGMARETAATFDRKLQYPKIEVKNESDNIDDYIDDIEIDKELCNRY
ncbi:MAG: phenylalanine--tRNA ligase subunit beta, partial [Tissierellia bacterium]|nr:phenylalanine--tRNA ligase subunit beta [Tissierellia bacterium]